jgi:AcrR family transcriptional regulator
MDSILQNNIIQKATELFMQYGFKSVTVDDIARHAGISKKTLYENINDKDELVLLCIKEHLYSMHEKVKNITQTSINAIEEMIRVMILMEGDMCSMNPVGPIDLQRYYPTAYNFMMEFSMNEMMGSLVANLNKGIKEKVYRKNINVDIMAKHRVQSIFLMMQQTSKLKNGQEVAQVQREIMEHFVYGISTLGGHELIETQLSVLNKKGK